MDRKRYFSIDINMLEAGEHAMQNAVSLGFAPRATCQMIFQAMLNAAPIHPGAIRKAPNGLYLDGKRLPPKIFVHSDFDREGVRDERNGNIYFKRYYWYLRPQYRVELARILAHPNKRYLLGWRGDGPK